MADGTPLEIPLFPLNTVLFPGNRLDLRVFEVRYLDMVGRCHKEGRAFGVIALTHGQEVARPGETEQIAGMGTLAEIERLHTPQAGLYEVNCVATQRFRVLQLQRLKTALWVGQVVVLPQEPVVPIPPDLLYLRQAFRSISASAPLDTSGVTLDDCAPLAHAWLKRMPIETHTKQGLLEIETPLLRLELVGDWLVRLGWLPAEGPAAARAP